MVRKLIELLLEWFRDGFVRVRIGGFEVLATGLPALLIARGVVEVMLRSL